MQLNENEIRGIIEEVIKRYAGQETTTPTKEEKKVVTSGNLVIEEVGEAKKVLKVMR